MSYSRLPAWLAAITVCLLPHVLLAQASDEEEIEEMLQAFLAAADQRPAHEQFWAGDLVYTSSSGQRYGKAEILAGFDADETADEGPGTPTSYVGEEVDVRLYGDTAIVTFKLIGRPADGSETLYYYNTGVFLKRDDGWQVAAWQATKIPPDAYQ